MQLIIDKVIGYFGILYASFGSQVQIIFTQYVYVIFIRQFDNKTLPL